MDEKVPQSDITSINSKLDDLQKAGKITNDEYNKLWLEINDAEHPVTKADIERIRAQLTTMQNQRQLSTEEQSGKVPVTKREMPIAITQDQLNHLYVVIGILTVVIFVCLVAIGVMGYLYARKGQQQQQQSNFAVTNESPWTARITNSQYW